MVDPEPSAGERARQAAELSTQDDRLRFALAAGGLGWWELDLTTQVMTCSDLCKANYGRAAAARFSYEDLHACIHPDDRAGVLAAVERSLASGVDYDVEYRVYWPNNELHWVMVRGRVAYDAVGKPLRMLGVSLDISERKRMVEALRASEAELAQQAEQLRNADRLKDDFLATLAHELRNPLAPLRTGLELLAAEPAPQLATHTLGIMQRQLGHMVRLIDDLLDVSRITRGRLELKRARVALTTVIDAALEASRPFVERGQHGLQVLLPAHPVWIDADLTRIAQVVSNLIDNACQYTSTAGHITLSAHTEADTLVIEVADDGIGIPPDRLEEVFAMFTQVNRALERPQGGLGIGLALVRRLVELHGGSVVAASQGIGLGSKFTLRLPVAGEASPPLAANSQLEPVAPEPARQRILVVDDNDDAADLLSTMLEHAGYSTTTAHDGPSALAAVQAWSPDIVVLDIGLPGMSGYEVARQLRFDPPFAHIALIALTGWGTIEDKRKAVAAGFDIHLTKPIDARALQGALDQLTVRRSG